MESGLHQIVFCGGDIKQRVSRVIESVLRREEGYIGKYSLSPREIPRADAKGFPEGSGFINRPGVAGAIL